MKKFFACVVALIMLCGLACAESFDIATTNVNADPNSAYMCDIADYESVTFTFDFSNGSWGGGCVGWNDAATGSWTSTNWANDGETTITVNNADVAADEDGAKIVQVQTWWDASANGLSSMCTVTLTASEGTGPEVDNDSDVATSSDAEADTDEDTDTDAATASDAEEDSEETEQPATGDATSFVALVLIAIVAMGGVVFFSKKRA